MYIRLTERGGDWARVLRHSTGGSSLVDESEVKVAKFDGGWHDWTGRPVVRERREMDCL